MMFWDDVRFIFMVAVIGFIFPCAMVLGLVTADYVLCDKMNACDNLVEVRE